MILEILYVIILLATVGLSLWLRRQIIMPARPRRFWRWFYLVAAAMVAAETWVASKSVDGVIVGVFISGMLIVFATWRRGLTTESIIGGLGSLRQYRNLSAIQIQAVGTGSVLQAMVGAVTVIRLQFNQPPEALAAFLQKHWEAQRVIIVK